MAITINNLNSMSLLNILNNTSAAQSTTLTQLSTGSRINSGKDDPAGLIAMRGLQTELVAVEAAISNNERTDAMLNVADKSLGEVADLVNEIKELAIASANDDALSASEIAANQSQVDEALSAIDRIIGTTQFNGQKLLDGSLGVDVSGVDTGDISDLKVSRRSDSALTVNVEVTAAAEQATKQIATTSATDDTALYIQGKDGGVVIDIAAGEDLSDVADKINASTAETGVTASASGGDLSITSSAYGSDAFVSVSVVDTESTDTSFASAHGARDEGVDATVTINGSSASVDGKEVYYTANGASFSFRLTDTLNEAAATSSFTISASGGATFQLGTRSDTRTTIGLDGLYSHQLGNFDTGYLNSLKGGEGNDLTTDPNTAAQIATAAADQLASAQGRLGGFLKFQVDTSLAQLTATQESYSAALSTVRDVDYAQATADLSRQNVLMQSAMSLLGMANQQSTQVLSLLS